VSAFPGPLPSTASPVAKDVADSGGTVFNEVMAAYSGLVFSTALRKLAGDAESAREVTQNVFLMAFRKREVLATLAYPAAWFHRAAMLESNNFLRMESRRRKHLEACTAEQSVVHDEASAGLSKAVRAQLDEALHGLREPERELILSRFFEGRSFQELAERRGSTPDAVRMKLTRILEKLSSVLKRQGMMVNQPKAVDSPVMFPKNPVEGNDDPILTPPRFDETSDPYVAVTDLGEDLNHAVGELTSNDTPALNVYDIFAVQGRTFAKELDFREFMRLELSDGSRTAGRSWFRISDYKDWHHYMKVEYEAGTRSWKNAGSISALTTP
jgi:RNA polymerase sigma factor (sigma-70 family)